jgi:hypothetical protein
VVMCRFDFVRGYGGQFVREYVLATEPHYVVGEYWDSLDYDGSVPRINQDRHRQQTVDWITAAGGAATAFDVTTKGILHAVFEVSAFVIQFMHPACNTGNTHRYSFVCCKCTQKGLLQKHFHVSLYLATLLIRLSCHSLQVQLAVCLS